MNETRRIRTLLPMACDGVGPSQTCLSIARGIHRAGGLIDVFANRSRLPKPEFQLTLALGGPILSKLPYRLVHDRATPRLERQFLDSVQPGEIAYLWPAASIEAHRELHRRGVPVVMEAINTRMASARKILDAAYERIGVAPVHGITDERIAEEEEKFRLAHAIFAPNRNVEIALRGSPLENRFLPASYGVDTSNASAPRAYVPKDALTFVFGGFACVRKGVHFLLDIWESLPGGHRLQILGDIEPVIADRYKDILNSDRVECPGFVGNVHSYMKAADGFVMPSLEEGDPLVTYEAAIHGLPIVASPMGASRLGDVEGTMLIIDPADRDAFEDAILQVTGSVELRRSLGESARRASAEFDWLDVGARRAEQFATSDLLKT